MDKINKTYRTCDHHLPWGQFSTEQGGSLSCVPNDQLTISTQCHENVVTRRMTGQSIQPGKTTETARSHRFISRFLQWHTTLTRQSDSQQQVAQQARMRALKPCHTFVNLRYITAKHTRTHTHMHKTNDKSKDRIKDKPRLLLGRSMPGTPLLRSDPVAGRRPRVGLSANGAMFNWNFPDPETFSSTLRSPIAQMASSVVAANIYPSKKSRDCK